MLTVPSESIRYHPSRETAKHAAYSKYADCNGIKPVHSVVVEIHPVSVLINVFHEICDVLKVKIQNIYRYHGDFVSRKIRSYFARSVDDTSVVSELKHA